MARAERLTISASEIESALDRFRFEGTCSIFVTAHKGNYVRVERSKEQPWKTMYAYSDEPQQSAQRRTQ